MNNSKQKKQVSQNNFNAIFVATFAVIIAILVAVIIIMLVAQNADEPEETLPSIPIGTGEDQIYVPLDTTPFNSEIKMPELEIISVEDGDPNVNLKTNYCELHYPSMYYDLLKTDVYFGDGTGCIIFSANLGSYYATVYNIIFNGEDGRTVGTLQLEGIDEPIRVSVAFYEPSNTVLGEALESFYAAQETFNDIISALRENENFTFTD